MGGSCRSAESVNTPDVNTKNRAKKQSKFRTIEMRSESGRSTFADTRRPQVEPGAQSPAASSHALRSYSNPHSQAHKRSEKKGETSTDKKKNSSDAQVLLRKGECVTAPKHQYKVIHKESRGKDCPVLGHMKCTSSFVLKAAMRINEEMLRKLKIEAHVLRSMDTSNKELRRHFFRLVDFGTTSDFKLLGTEPIFQYIVGPRGDEKCVYFIDFWSARPKRKNSPLKREPTKFDALVAHKGCAPDVIDDFESWMYMAIYLIHSEALSWSKITDSQAMMTAKIDFLFGDNNALERFTKAQFPKQFFQICDKIREDLANPDPNGPKTQDMLNLIFDMQHAIGLHYEYGPNGYVPNVEWEDLIMKPKSGTRESTTDESSIAGPSPDTAPPTGVCIYFIGSTKEKVKPKSDIEMECEADSARHVVTRKKERLKTKGKSGKGNKKKSNKPKSEEQLMKEREVENARKIIRKKRYADMGRRASAKANEFNDKRLVNAWGFNDVDRSDNFFRDWVEPDSQEHRQLRERKEEIEKDPTAAPEVDVDVAAAAAEAALSAIAVVPPICKVSAAGGISEHLLTNQSALKLAFNVRSSANSNYTMSVTGGFIDVGETLPFVITRKAGKAQKDKLVIQFCDAKGPNIMEHFKGEIEGEVIGETVIKLSAAE